MKNKIELKKMCITSCIVIIIFLITFSILIYKQYKTYTYNFNQKIAGIIDNVLEKYPDIEKREIVEILNSSDKTNNEILREYGIELDKDSVILENNTDFQKFIIIDVSTLIVFILILSIIVFKYNHSESKKINEITKYIEEINRGNYKLNIEENTEDELSILKNELYKITIKLKEVAENSQKDKTTLKDSLSDISHQIKTPITSILIMLDNILSDENMPEDIKKDFIKDIKREIVNIKFLVESILKLSKIDSNSIKFIKKEVFIKDIINDFTEKSIKCITVDFQRVWQISCTEEMRKLLEKAKVEFEKAGFRSRFWAYRPFRYKCCYADSINHYVVNYDGRIFKCTARDYGEELTLGHLLKSGEIDWNDGILSKMFVKATFENERCENCRVLPLCMGPCIQKNYDALINCKQLTCVYDNVEYSLSSFVIEMAKQRNLI